MNNKKRYIALLLLLGFSFPQAANSVHHFLISHAGYSEEVSGQVFAVPPYDYHSCDYQLTGIDLIVPRAVQEHSVLIPAFSKKESVHSPRHSVAELAFHYTLRGPPEQLISL